MLGNHMEDIRWILGVTPENLPESWKERIRNLFRNETGELYSDKTFEMLQIPEWQGNQLLIDHSKYPSSISLIGVLWSKPLLENKIRIVAFVIDNKYQSHGHGSYAMSELFYHANSIGRNDIQLEVRCSNIRAQEFYKKLGFDIDQKIKGYYSNEDGFLMTGKV